MGNVIVILAVIWALAYSAYRLADFIRNAGKDKPVKCSCSSCPYAAGSKK